MGLLARVFESQGLPTVCLHMLREVAERVKAPRTVLVKFPLTAAPVGRPGDKAQQRQVVLDTLAALGAIAQPGTILELPYSWE